MLNVSTPISIYVRPSVSCEIEVFIDSESGTVHLFDLDKQGTRSLTNSAEEAISAVISKYSISSPQSYTWLLYGTDGVISSFGDGNFIFASDDVCLPMYKDEMLYRRRKYD